MKAIWLCPNTGFVSYAALATLAGGRPISVPLTRDLHIDVEKAKTLMDGARILMLNSPANPTGSVESKESIKALVEYADDAGVTVISDEVYEHFIYGKKHWSAARFGENVVTINAASKTYAMTGWRLGYLAAQEEIVAECVKVHQYCQACATSISQYAAYCRLHRRSAPGKIVRDEYRERRNIICKGLANLGFKFSVPEGAFYLFVPMKRCSPKKSYRRVLSSSPVQHLE